MPRLRFIVTFLILLAAFEFSLLIETVDRKVILPFTNSIAVASASIIRTAEGGVRVSGTTISAPCFAVDIKNGCNGVEATLFVLAAVLAFPATWMKKIIGVILGGLIIQAANLIRVVTLFLIGCRHRAWFDTFHLAIWQTAIFGIAVGFFVVWSRRSAPPNAAARA
ncbi:MAG TPA: exosortase H [Thermoanaerobaculia bacterium]|nr:exosortase H [Thermoanaerobaculia bacterium]